MTDFIKKLESKENLSFEESKDLFSNIMEGKYDEDSIIKILNALSDKGETKDELGGSEYYEYIHNFIGGVAPKVDFSLEECMEYIKVDEYLEVTPSSLRMRKITFRP